MMKFTAHRGSPEGNIFNWVIRWTEIIFWKNWVTEKTGSFCDHSIRWIKIHFQTNIHVSRKIPVLLQNVNIRGNIGSLKILQRSTLKTTKRWIFMMHQDGKRSNSVRGTLIFGQFSVSVTENQNNSGLETKYF